MEKSAKYEAVKICLDNTCNPATLCTSDACTCLREKRGAGHEAGQGRGEAREGGRGRGHGREEEGELIC